MIIFSTTGKTDALGKLEKTKKIKHDKPCIFEIVTAKTYAERTFGSRNIEKSYTYHNSCLSLRKRIQIYNLW